MSVTGWHEVGKGTKRRPEDKTAIEKNWPFADPRTEKGCVVWFDKDGVRHVNGTGVELD
jgi:hypothetical protein